jgi:hypothetical protein
MAQSRARRNQRRRRRPAPPVAAPPVARPRRNLRRVVIAFLVLVGLAGILAVTAPDTDPAGAPADVSPASPSPSRR